MTNALDILQTKLATTKELVALSGLSQPTVSRQIRDLGRRVVKLGKRPHMLALTVSAFGAGDRIAIYSVGRHGNPVVVGFLRPLAVGGFVVESTTGTPPVLLGDSEDGRYDGLPYFLEDLRPQGYLGRKIARIFSQRIGVPADPRLWSTDQVGRYLLSNGDSTPGNLVLGDHAFYRVPRQEQQVPRSDYPAMAEMIMGEELPGFSAGGEQPKFAVYSTEAGHVIVKFSPRGDERVAQRWKDILLSEFHASQVLHEKAPCSGPETAIFEADGRLFLESRRFDRHGELGRLPMISLLAVDAEFAGTGGTWPQAMQSLVNRGLVSQEHVFDANVLNRFGKLICNTDMHLGNLSLAIDGGVFHLLPAYDMCSMGFAPRSNGEIQPYDLSFIPQLISQTETPQDGAMEQLVNETALEFWRRMYADQRISSELRDALDTVLREEGG